MTIAPRSVDPRPQYVATVNYRADLQIGSVNNGFALGTLVVLDRLLSCRWARL
jgi:hypothetical protein